MSGSKVFAFETFAPAAVALTCLNPSTSITLVPIEWPAEASSNDALSIAIPLRAREGYAGYVKGDETIADANRGGYVNEVQTASLRRFSFFAGTSALAFAASLAAAVSTFIPQIGDAATGFGLIAMFVAGGSGYVASTLARKL